MKEKVSEKIELLARRWWQPDDEDRFLRHVENITIPSNNLASNIIKELEKSPYIDSEKKSKLIDFFQDNKGLEFYIKSLELLPWEVCKAKTIFFVKNDIKYFSCNKSLLTAEIEERIKHGQNANEIQSFLEEMGLKFVQELECEEVYGLGKIKLDLRFIDLSYADFSNGFFIAGGHLEGSCLIEAKFSNAIIIKSHFERCDLRLSRFDNSKCNFTKFSGAVLTGANFDHANLANCDFSEADLCMACFNSSDLTGAVLIHSNIDGLIFDGNTKIDSDTIFTSGKIEIYRKNKSKYLQLYKDDKSCLYLLSPLEQRIKTSPNCFWSDLSWIHNLKKAEERKYFTKLRSEYEENTRKTYKNYLNIKKLLRTNGYYSEANNFLYQELRYRRKSKSKLDIRFWAEYIFEISTGYCLKPLRALLSSALIILIFAALFLININHIIPGDDTSGLLFNLKKAIYFSIVTFTTLGYGDYHPDLASWVSWLCNIESLLGLLLVGLFVVSLAKLILKE